MKAVGIVGLGPRGLSILERLVACSINKVLPETHLLIFDPNKPGVGCHDTDQPDYLLVNTPVDQITVFSDDSIKNSGPILLGPNFFQWLVEQNTCETIPKKIDPNGYYSRNLFGRYLNWSFHYMIEQAPCDLKITYINHEVVDIEQKKHSWLLKTSNRFKYPIDYLLLTTGHTKKNIKHTNKFVISDPYPIADKLSGITKSDKVIIQGMGLTMCDVMAQLTVGRGGKFIRSDTHQKLSYLSSGEEPSIIAFSRSGLPLSSRANNQKSISQHYQPKFLTAEAIARIRKKGPINFLEDILPLLICDMEYAYYATYMKNNMGIIAMLTFCNSYQCASKEARTLLINKAIKKEDRFSWEKLVSPTPKSALVSKASFSEWLYGYLQEDLYEAKQGNIDSPIKAAGDVLRDLGNFIREVVEFGGLMEDSHRWVINHFVPIMNRIAVGPPKERTEEMLALIDSSILSIDLGPNPIVTDTGTDNKMTVQSSLWPDYMHKADIMVKANIAVHSPVENASPLWKRLFSQDYVRLYYNNHYHPGGIEVTENLQVVSKEGTPYKNFWSLGVPTEGSKFYTFMVPRPQVNSTAIVDAGHVVNQLIEALQCTNKEMRLCPVNP